MEGDFEHKNFLPFFYFFFFLLKLHPLYLCLIYIRSSTTFLDFYFFFIDVVMVKELLY